jgi:hypothetical protein
MTAQIVLNVNNADDLVRLLQILKESGLEQLVLKTKTVRKKKPTPSERTWSFGIGNIGGKLDGVNIRDFAHE